MGIFRTRSEEDRDEEQRPGRKKHYVSTRLANKQTNKKDLCAGFHARNQKSHIIWGDQLFIANILVLLGP